VRAPQSVDFSAMLPSTGLIPYYVSEAMRLTRAPVVYHLASVVTLLGAVLDPVACCYLMMGPGLNREERLFLWMLLVGPTDNKKTYSTELALEVFGKQLAHRVRGPEGGRKGLEDMLLAEPYPVVHMREAGAFFANNRQAYSADGATFWTQAYDGSYQPRNIANPNLVMDRIKVGVTMLGMGPSSEIQRSTRASDWYGGLFPRLNICQGPAIKRGPGGAGWPPEVLRRLGAGVERIRAVAEKAHYLVVAREARALWNLWSERHSQALERGSDLHASMGSRLSWHVLRIATIFAASRFSTTVERQDVVAACNFGHWLRRSAMSMEPGY
jgi:hypothetical protein